MRSSLGREAALSLALFPRAPLPVGGSPVAGVALFSKGAGESTKERLREAESVNRLAYAWPKSEVVFSKCHSSDEFETK